MSGHGAEGAPEPAVALPCGYTHASLSDGQAMTVWPHPLLEGESMKKPNSAKLQLNRETLRALEQAELKNVDGGVSANASCELTSCNNCTTRNTCTTRYC